jgi:hypothetical protein
VSLLRLFACCALLIPTWCWAGSVDCERHKDPDQRYLCTALTMKNMNFCSQISSGDGVNYCKAMIMGSSGYCEKIKGGQRAQCISGVRLKQRQSLWGLS